MSDYKTYTFTIGDSPKRNYKGIRAPVSKGSQFAFQIMEKWKLAFMSFVNEILEENRQAIENGDELDSRQKEKLETSFLLKICMNYDLEEVMNQGNKVLSNAATQIIASEENSSSSYALSNEKQFDEWFEKYPGDLMEVYGCAIWNNVNPFLNSIMEKLQMAASIVEEENMPPTLNQKADPGKI